MSDMDNMAGRATVYSANESLPMRTVQLEIFTEDTRDDVEHFEPYGFTSGPQSGAEAVALSLGGDRDHTLAIVISDRRYRIKLQTGEVAIYDDQGQSVHLSRDGIKVDGAGKPITISNTSSVTADTPLFKVTGDIIAGGEVMDANGSKSMSGMRATYNSHTHAETNSTTKAPNEAM